MTLRAADVLPGRPGDLVNWHDDATGARVSVVCLRFVNTDVARFRVLVEPSAAGSSATIDITERALERVLFALSWRGARVRRIGRAHWAATNASRAPGSAAAFVEASNVDHITVVDM